MSQIPEVLSTLDPREIEDIELKCRGSQPNGAIFLGTNETLQGVIEADLQDLAYVGVTPGEIADRLDAIADRVVKEAKQRRQSKLPSGDMEIEDGDLIYSIQTWYGGPSCPFGCEAGTALDFFIQGKEGAPHYKSIVKFSGLIPHMVREHHFFEGKAANSGHRVEPLALCLLLSLGNKDREEIENTFAQRLIQDLYNPHALIRETALAYVRRFSGNPRISEAVAPHVEQAKQYVDCYSSLLMISYDSSRRGNPYEKSIMEPKGFRFYTNCDHEKVDETVEAIKREKGLSDGDIEVTPFGFDNHMNPYNYMSGIYIRDNPKDTP